MTSILTTAKNEIAAASPTMGCCKPAFLSGLVRSSGKLHITTDGIRVEIPTENGFDKKLAELVKEVAVNLTVDKRDGVVVVSGGGVVSLLVGLGIFIADQSGEIAISLGISPGVVKEDCCAVNYLRGAFLGAGTLSTSSGYRLEIAFNSLEPARDMIKLLARFGITARLTTRKEKHAVYIKESEAVSDTLALMGASGATLELNSIFADRAFNSKINRQTNCDVGNIAKTVAASMRQIEDIEYILTKTTLTMLPEKLAVVAAARLNNPDQSFAQLALDLGLSKSTLKNRLNKLAEMADMYRAKGE